MNNLSSKHLTLVPMLMLTPMLTLMLTLINDKTCLTRKAFVEQFVDSELEFMGEVSQMVQNVMYAHGEAVLDGRCSKSTRIRSLTALNTDSLNSVSCSPDHAIPSF